MAAIMVISLAACGSEPTASVEVEQDAEQFGVASEDKTDTQEQSVPEQGEAPADPGELEETDVPEEENNVAADAPEQAEDALQADPGETDSTTGGTLIVYFSPANADSVDAISSATPRVGDLSSVEHIAQMIHQQVDADIAKIVPVEAYPLEYRATADQAKAEQDDDARPDFTLDVNPEDYDVIFVGYPIWHYHLPMIMQSFFESYDFSGKTVIPFNTHAGSRDGGTYEDIAAMEPGATVFDGLAVQGEQAGEAESSVRDWLLEIG